VRRDGGWLRPIDAAVYQVVWVEIPDKTRDRVVEFAMWAADRRAPYAGLATVSTAVWAITNSRLLFFMDARSPARASWPRRWSGWERVEVNAAGVTPAQLAAAFGAPPPPS